MEASNITKMFGKTKALDDINFSIDKGEIFGFIGPDGSGKTTIFRILATLLVPDKGKAFVENYDTIKNYKEIRNILGYMPGRFSLYNDLSVEENLRFYATIFGTTIEENYYLIKNIYSHIEPFKKRLAGKLSGGMKQKLALSCALIHKPKVLILDEPTTGVDAVSRKEFWEGLKTLLNYDITIIVSTSYMDEAMLCDRVALIQEGKIMKTAKPESIINDYKKIIYTVSSANMWKLINSLLNFPGKDTVYPFGQNVHYTHNGELNIHDLYKFLEENGNESVEIKKTEAGIEDCFMELMVK